MPHDIFISYSSKDKPIADGICANLEAAGLRCWIAPRDITPGDDWPTAITAAISASKVMVLVFSANSNASADVGREIILAANYKLIIIPFKIEDVEPEPGKQYYLAQTHWLDAMNPPTRDQIRVLVETTRAFVPAIEPAGIVQIVSAPSHPQPFQAIAKPASDPVPVSELLGDRSSQTGAVGKKSWFRRAYLWTAVPIFLIILLAGFWTKLQGLTTVSQPTPTIAASAPSIPTSTDLPEATITVTPAPTNTVIPMMTATLTTGTVIGYVVWGDDPFEGVNVMLCADWAGSCKGLAYNSTSDVNGKFLISGIEPGIYTVIPSVPEQLGISIPMDEQGEIQVSAGETVILDKINQCKYDLQVNSPVVQNGKVTLRWAPYPGGGYRVEIADFYWNSSDGKSISSSSSAQLSYTSQKTFPSGSYIWYVMAWGQNGLCRRSVGRFTIP